MSDVALFVWSCWARNPRKGSHPVASEREQAATHVAPVNESSALGAEPLVLECSSSLYAVHLF
jgi:hypothetical protein